MYSYQKMTNDSRKSIDIKIIVSNTEIHQENLIIGHWIAVS